LLGAVSAVWEHRNVSQPFGLRHGEPRISTVVQALVAAAFAALLVAAATEEAASAGSEPLRVVADLVVAITWMAVAAALWSRASTRRNGVLAGAVAASWLFGSIDPAFVFLHRGPLAHVLLAYPAGRLHSAPARVAVAAAYLDGILAGSGGGPAWTLAFASVLMAAASVRLLVATGVVRRSRVLPFVVGGAVGVVLTVGAVARLAGGDADVLPAYELVLVLAGLAITVDLRTARWSQGSITGLVVDLGAAPVGGVVRERLARAVGDPTLTVAYVLDGGRAPVDEHGQPVELPPLGADRVVTPVDLAGKRLALLIHDPAVLAELSLVDGATSALSIAVANAQLQTEVRARVTEVEASTQRLLAAADAERRRLASDLRARVDSSLQQTADELRAAGAEGALLARVESVRDQLFRLVAGLDPLVVHEHGLGQALRDLAQHAGIPVSVRAPAERYPPEVETCVWFTCAEAVANTLKHAEASKLEIVVDRRGDALHVEVSDDGVGCADPARGTGLGRLAERVERAGGKLAIRSPANGGTRIVAELDVGASG
jgi:signal transduction histidine kinase